MVPLGDGLPTIALQLTQPRLECPMSNYFAADGKASPNCRVERATFRYIFNKRPQFKYTPKKELLATLAELKHPARWRLCQWPMSSILNYASSAFALPTCRRREYRRSDGNVRIVTLRSG